MKEQEQTYEGWDVYGDYGYDEVKVIAMLHKALMDRKWYPDWEEVMRTGHTIYHIWNSQFKEDGTLDNEWVTRDWMKIQNREEGAYVQAWFTRTQDKFINKYKKLLEVY